MATATFTVTVRDFPGSANSATTQVNATIPDAPPPPPGDFSMPPELEAGFEQGTLSNQYVKYLVPGDSLQAAYDSLPFPGSFTGGGTLILAPGRYNVGSGLIIERTKCVTITALAPRPRVFGSTNPPFPILYSSQTPNFLVATSAPSFSANGQGLALRGLGFELSPGKSAVMGDCMSYALLEDCYVSGTGGWALELGSRDEFGQDHGDDASYWRLQRNYCDGVGLLKTRGTGTVTIGGVTKGYQHNNNMAIDNVVVNATPALDLYGQDRTIFANNDFRGTSANGTIRLKRCFRCAFIANAGGNAAGDGFRWMVVDKCNGLYLADVGHRGSLTNYKLYSFTNSGGQGGGAIDNLIVAPTWGADSITHNPAIDMGGIVTDASSTTQWYLRQGAHHIGTAV